VELLSNCLLYHVQWGDKRFTGFAAKWHFEDDSGNKVDIKQDDQYLDEMDVPKNTHFVIFMNILYYAVNIKELSQLKVFTAVESVRIEWVYDKDADNSKKCSYKEIIQDE
jgi:CO dehydrogenase/acetyl-CoA synthase epsilon subunit